jgi:hypothetical protein
MKFIRSSKSTTHLAYDPNSAVLSLANGAARSVLSFFPSEVHTQRTVRPTERTFEHGKPSVSVNKTSGALRTRARNLKDTVAGYFQKGTQSHSQAQPQQPISTLAVPAGTSKHDIDIGPSAREDYNIGELRRLLDSMAGYTIDTKFQEVYGHLSAVGRNVPPGSVIGLESMKLRRGIDQVQTELRLTEAFVRTYTDAASDWDDILDALVAVEDIEN